MSPGLLGLRRRLCGRVARREPTVLLGHGARLLQVCANPVKVFAADSHRVCRGGDGDPGLRLDQLEKLFSPGPGALAPSPLGSECRDYEFVNEGLQVGWTRLGDLGPSEPRSCVCC